MIGSVDVISRVSTPDSEQDSIAGEIMKLKGCDDWYMGSSWETGGTSKSRGCGGLWDTEINLFDDLNAIISAHTDKAFVADNRPWSVDISDLPPRSHSRRPASLPLLKMSTSSSSTDSCDAMMSGKLAELVRTGSSETSSDTDVESQPSSRAVLASQRIEISASAMYNAQKPSLTTGLSVCCNDATPDGLLTTPAGFYERPRLFQRTSLDSDQLTPTSSGDSDKLSEVCSTCDDDIASLTSLYAACDSADVDTLDCVRSVLQTVLPEEISLASDASCLRLLRQLTAGCSATQQPVAGVTQKLSRTSDRPQLVKTPSHLNPDAPSFNYSTHHAAAPFYPVAFRPAGDFPMNFTPATFVTLPTRPSPRQRRQHAQANGARVIWRPTPMAITYTPVYDGAGRLWSAAQLSTPAASAGAGPSALPVYSYYPQYCVSQPVYMIGHGPVHIMNHTAASAIFPLTAASHRRRHSDKNTTSASHSRAAA